MSKVIICANQKGGVAKTNHNSKSWYWTCQIRQEGIIN